MWNNGSLGGYLSWIRNKWWRFRLRESYSALAYCHHWWQHKFSLLLLPVTITLLHWWPFIFSAPLTCFFFFSITLSITKSLCMHLHFFMCIRFYAFHIHLIPLWFIHWHENNLWLPHDSKITTNNYVIWKTENTAHITIHQLQRLWAIVIIFLYTESNRKWVTFYTHSINIIGIFG